MKTFIVGLLSGCDTGSEGHSEIHDVQMIDAEVPREAQHIYNEKNKCSYFYGLCLGEFDKEKRCLMMTEDAIEMAFCVRFKNGIMKKLHEV